MTEENSWLGRKVVAAGATLLAAGALAWATPAVADTAATGNGAGDVRAVTGQADNPPEPPADGQPAGAGATLPGTPVDDASKIPALSGLDGAGGPPPLPDDMGENPRPGMDPVGAPEKRHGAEEGEVLPPPVKVNSECAPADDCATLWVWAASMMVDPEITLRQMNAWRAQAAQKGVLNAEGEPIEGAPLVWSDSLAFAAQELAVELALGADPSTLERLDGSGSVIGGAGNTFFPNTHITGVGISNLTSVQGTLDAWYVQSEAYWWGPTSTVYYTTGDYANAVSNDAKAVGMASVMLSNQEVYTVCLFGDKVPEEADKTSYAPTTGGAIYQGVNVRKDNLFLQLVTPETLTAGQPVELGINATTTLTGNAVGRAAGVAIDSTELFEQADVQVVQAGAVVGEVADGVLQASEGFVSGPATLQVVMAGEVVASADIEVVAVPVGLGHSDMVEVTLASGSALELPQTMSVLWSGGTMTDEAVTWEPLSDEQLAMMAGREGGAFEVAGTVEVAGADVVAKVTVTPASPVFAQAPEAQQVWVGGEVELPQTVAVTWSNGDVTDEVVAWDALDTSVAGGFEVAGTVEGLADPVVAHVDVLALEVAGVEGQDVQVSVASGSPAVGLVPDALSVANVTWSDGSVTQEQIAWDEPDAEMLAVLASREGGSFVLAGTVGDTGAAASATVTVEPATPVSAESVAAQQIWVGGEVQLPQTVAVTWSNGDVTDELVAWDVLDTSVAGTFVVAGAVGDTGLSVEAAVEVRALQVEGLGEVAGLAVSVTSGTASVDAVAALPQTAPVMWSDGSVTDEPVAWFELDADQLAILAGREGGTVEVSGTVGDTGQTLNATVEVAPAEPVAAQVAPVEGDVWVDGSVELPQTVTVTWSNGDVTEEPVVWGAPDTSQAGIVEVQGTVEALAEPVIATFEVKEPEATGLGEVSGLEVVAASGQAATDVLGTLPQTAPVTWSDGSVTEEPIVWADLDEAQQAVLFSREGGAIDIAGEVPSASQTVTAHVEVAPATPVSAQAPDAQEVWVEAAPVLPESVQVSWSNGDVTEGPVAWGEADTSQPGTVEVQGTVEGLADPVIAVVEVKAPEAVSAGDQPVEASVPSGILAADALAALPQTVPVSWSDGSVTEEPVAWGELTPEQEAVLSGREGGSLEVQGAVGQTGQAVSATVVVAPADPVSAEVAPVEGDVWVDGAVELPQTAAVTWSNGDVTAEPVVWGEADTSQPGTVEVQGTVEGLADPVAVTFEVKAPEAVAVALADIDALSLEVEPGEVPDLPDTAQVSWSDGQTSEEPVVWDMPDAAEFAAGADVKVSGEVESTEHSVEVAVHVKDEEPPVESQVDSGEKTPADTQDVADAQVGPDGADSQSNSADAQADTQDVADVQADPDSIDPQSDSADAQDAADTQTGTNGADSQASTQDAPDASAQAPDSTDTQDSTDSQTGTNGADSQADAQDVADTQVDPDDARDASDSQSGITTQAPDSADTQDAAGQDKAGQGVSPTRPAAPTADSSSGECVSDTRAKAGLPPWFIATLAGLGAAFVAAVAYVVAKRRHANDDDEPIGKHAAPKNK